MDGDFVFIGAMDFGVLNLVAPADALWRACFHPVCQTIFGQMSLLKDCPLVMKVIHAARIFPLTFA